MTSSLGWHSVILSLHRQSTKRTWANSLRWISIKRYQEEFEHGPRLDGIPEKSCVSIKEWALQGAFPIGYGNIMSCLDSKTLVRKHKQWSFAINMVLHLQRAPKKTAWYYLFGLWGVLGFIFSLAQVGCWTPTSPIWPRPSHASASASGRQPAPKETPAYSWAIFMED